jgi:hypothetical protein
VSKPSIPPQGTLGTGEALFRRSAIIVLFITAAAKLLSATGQAALLEFPDPLIGLTNRHVLLLVGSVELAVAAGLISALGPRNKYLLLAWLSANFLLYRVGFHSVSPGKPCPCLGTLTESLPLSQGTVDVLLWSAVIYLLLGSVLILGQLGRRSSLGLKA